MKNNHLKLNREWIIKAGNYSKEECKNVLEIARKLTKFILNKID